MATRTRAAIDHALVWKFAIADKMVLCSAVHVKDENARRYAGQDGMHGMHGMHGMQGQDGVCNDVRGVSEGKMSPPYGLRTQRGCGAEAQVEW